MALLPLSIKTRSNRGVKKFGKSNSILLRPVLWSSSFPCSALKTDPPLSHREPLKTIQECPESTLVTMLPNAHPTISNVKWKEGALLIWGPEEKCPGWTALTQGQVLIVGGGILGVEMATTLDGLRSVIPTESAGRPRTGHVTGKILCRFLLECKI